MISVPTHSAPSHSVIRARWIATALAVVGTLALLGSADLTAQRRGSKDIPRYRMDPYTRNDPRAMEKAGYVSYAPFEFGQRGAEPTTTEAIDEYFEGELEILWVETEHFKLGFELPAWPVPLQPNIRNRIRSELERLEERTGWKRVNPRTRVLDPWLRLHLMAQRLEDHYQTFLDYTMRTDADFPTEGGVRINGEYRGQGPYLGQPAKYTILVLEKQRDYSNYLLDFTGRKNEGGQRWNFKNVGTLFYGVSTESENGRLKSDTALYCNLIFNATHAFVDGFELYTYDLPVWIREGLAHWFERQVDPNWNSFTRSEGSMEITKANSKWKLEARKIIAQDDFTPFLEAYQWRDFGQIKFDDHVAIWSRWDYLMSKGKEPFAKFMADISGRVGNNGLSSGKDLVEAVRNALQDAYNISPLTIDEQWKNWVIDNYPTR